jgi:hypothetical protein
MTMGAPPAPGRLPTLTEVVAWPGPPAAAGANESGPAAETGVAEADVVAAGPLAPAAAPGAIDAQAIERVMAEVQRQVDLMLEYRVREALTPLLSRAADTIVREARAELALTLRDVVARAMAQEIARHRSR